MRANRKRILGYLVIAVIFASLFVLAGVLAGWKMAVIGIVVSLVCGYMLAELMQKACDLINQC